jgi:hypothetical protein
MDQAISIIVGGVVLAVSYLMDHPIFVAALLAWFFFFKMGEELFRVLQQIQQELQDLERHLDSQLRSVQRRLDKSLWDLSNRLP